MNRSLGIVVVLALQLVCAFFFVGGIFATVFGLDLSPINWALYEYIEIGAAVGLLLGVAISWTMLRRSLRRTAKAEGILADLSGAFMDLVQARFDEWQLTPAEQDVALFVLKGMGTSEIAQLRGTSEGTVKAQTNAIYRKADVANRAQLASLFIDDLMQDDALK